LLNHDNKNNAGCKPYDVVMMFNIILLKRIYNLSDEQAEYQINARSSFKGFLGLSSGDRVPDARKIWAFQDSLVRIWRKYFLLNFAIIWITWGCL
jgi:hypothetical protein